MNCSSQAIEEGEKPKHRFNYIIDHYYANKKVLIEVAVSVLVLFSPLY